MSGTEKSENWFYVWSFTKEGKKQEMIHRWLCKVSELSEERLRKNRPPGYK